MMINIDKDKVLHIDFKDIIFDKLYIEVTNKCGLNCKHCFNDSKSINNDFINIENIRHIIVDAQKKGVKMIILSGGEPFEHANIMDIVHLIKSYGFKIKIISNGTLIKEQQISKLIEYNVEIQLTLNGSNSYIDSLTRSSSSFDLTINTINTIIKLGGTHLVIISTTIHKGNQSDLISILKLVKKFGVKNHIVSFIQKKGRAILKWDEYSLDFENQISIIKDISQFINNNKEQNIIFSGMYFIKKIFGNKLDLDKHDDYIEEIAIRANMELDIGEEVTQFLSANGIENLFWEKECFNKGIYIPINENFTN